MNKTAINPARLQWCLENYSLTLQDLSHSVKISMTTFQAVMDSKPSLTINQLRKIACFFNKSVLFFLNQDVPDDKKILSLQFRTMNHQKPIHSRKLRGFIEHVEKLRAIYVALIKEMGDQHLQTWYPSELDFHNTDDTTTATLIRTWIGIDTETCFERLREQVESKGILVIVSNGYNGKWQIDRKGPVRGFSLYFDVLPVIVIKKQSTGAQTFTLFHELIHLLLHKNSVLDYDEDYYSDTGLEKEANKIAGQILIPESHIEKIDKQKLRNCDTNDIDELLNPFSHSWSVSNEAILYRLLQVREISEEFYRSYRNLKHFQHMRAEEELNVQQKPTIPRLYRYREPLQVFGKPYVTTVLDAYQSQFITLSKASTYLDNLKIRDIHKLVDYVVHV